MFCGSNILYSWFTMRQQKDQMVGAQAEQMKYMQYMMYLMPLMFFFMFNDYSSGLNFYYFISLFFSSIIMYLVREINLFIVQIQPKENVIPNILWQRFSPNSAFTRLRHYSSLASPVITDRHRSL